MATREQIRSFISYGWFNAFRDNAHFRTNFNNLDLARLENYFQFIFIEAISLNASWLGITAKDMGFMQKSMQGYVCTIAGLVLFGITPRRYLRQAGIRIEVFNTLEKNYNALLDVVLDGSMKQI